MRERLPEILLEVGSVVFAVLLALAVDEWRDNRAHQQLARTAEANILQEVASNRAELLGTRSANDTLLSNLRTMDSGPLAGAGGGPVISVDYQVAVLSSSAWQTAQVTQAVLYMDYDWIARVAELYDLQALHDEWQRDLVDRITDLGALPEGAVARSLRGITQRLQTVLATQDTILRRGEGLLRDAGKPITGSAGRARDPGS